MTTTQLQFIAANLQHFDLVLQHNQNFQASHDIASQVITIANTLPRYKNEPVTNCTGCIQEAYQEVWNEYQLIKPKKK